MKNSVKISFFVIFSLVFIILFFQKKDFLTRSFSQKTGTEPYITVFIHGSFGSLLGFLNASDVLKDQVSGTIYRKVNKGMRNDSFFYRFQPILQRGLISVKPTFDLRETNNQFLAAYPLIKAYDVIAEKARPREKNYYYTFGWSGLMSQNSRRFEAIRLYNALSEELEKFHAKGIYPKIRLIAHSHGGNLGLNLAAVYHLVNLASFSAIHAFSQNPEENESLKKMYAVMRTLPSREAVRHSSDQKRFSYIPMNRNLIINDLILYGTPIQPETESFVCSPIFKKVYNFYSSEDIIQKFDWVTSKRAYSFQRVGDTKLLEEKRMGACVIQVKIMIEKNNNGGKGFKPVAMASTEEKKSVKNEVEQSIWQQLMAGENIFARKSKDPTHKELWFFCWKDCETDSATFLGHLPIFILTPLFLTVLEKTCDSCKDVDLNTHVRDKNLIITSAKHDHEQEMQKTTFPIDIIENIKHRSNAWKPDRWKSFDEFNEIRKYL